MAGYGYCGRYFVLEWVSIGHEAGVKYLVVRLKLLRRPEKWMKSQLCVQQHSTTPSSLSTDQAKCHLTESLIPLVMLPKSGAIWAKTKVLTSLATWTSCTDQTSVLWMNDWHWAGISAPGFLHVGFSKPPFLNFRCMFWSLHGLPTMEFLPPPVLRRINLILFGHLAPWQVSLSDLLIFPVWVVCKNKNTTLLPESMSYCSLHVHCCLWNHSFLCQYPNCEESSCSHLPIGGKVQEEMPSQRFH